MKTIFLMLIFIQASYAQESFHLAYPSEESEVAPSMVNPKQSEIREVVNSSSKVNLPESKTMNSKELRNKTAGTAMIGYQPVTSWLPSKKTISYSHFFNEKWSLEAEYAWSSIYFPVVGVDLGEISEKRYTLQARKYVGNSFHFTFGAIVNDFRARLGSDFLDSLGNEINSSFRVQNIGVTGGIGNRWQWENGLTLGIDWMRLNVPIVETKVEDNVLDSVSRSGDRSDIKKVIRTLNNIPTFVFLGLNIGYSF